MQMLGSILSNLLLVLGFSFLAGEAMFNRTFVVVGESSVLPGNIPRSTFVVGTVSWQSLSGDRSHRLAESIVPSRAAALVTPGDAASCPLSR